MRRAAFHPLHLVRSIVGLALAAGCGGGDGGGGGGVTPPPPPTPVVTTVTVAPATAALAAGDTLRLTATVLDQNGAVMSGKAVAWSSSAIAVASVSAAGTVTAVGAGSAIVSATVDGKSGSAQVTVALPPKVVLDPGRAATASVGMAGGTISATSAAGLRYDLVIPPGALDQTTAITVAPLKTFNRLGLSGGLVGAVEFSPDGLTFRSPVSLVIRSATAVGNGQRLVGFSFGANGDNLRLQPSVAAAGQVTLSLTHFSGAGAALGTVQDLAALPPPPNSSAQDTALVQLAGLTLPADQSAIVAVMQRWQRAIVARLALATTDVAARDARLESAAWVAQLNQYPAPDVAALRTALAGDLAALRTSLAAALGRGIASANQQCTSQRSLTGARNALLLQAAAEADSVAPTGSALSRASVLAALCVRPIVIDSLYPVNPAPNTAAPLDLRVGFAFTGTQPTQVTAIPFALTLDIKGSTSDRLLTVATNAAGQFSTPVTPTGAATLSVDVQACPDPSAFLFNYPCLAFKVQRAFGRTLNGAIVITTQSGFDSLSDVARIKGSLTIIGLTTSDLKPLGNLVEVSNGLSLANMSQLRSTRDLSRLETLGALGIQNCLLFDDLVLPAAVKTINVIQLLTLPSLRDLRGLSGIDSTNSLSLIQLDKVTSLAGLENLTIRPSGVLTVNTLPLLSSLNGLKPLSANLGGINIFNNAILSDLSPLSGVRALASLQVRDNPALTSFASLAQVDSVAGAFIVGGTGLASATFNVRKVGGVVQVFIAGFSPGEFKFPNLTTVSGVQVTSRTATLQGTTITCPNPTPIPIRFPQLPNIPSNFGIRTTGGATACHFLLDLPKLATVETLELNGNLDDLVLSVPLTIGLPGSSQGALSGGGLLSSFTPPSLTINGGGALGSPRLTRFGGTNGTTITGGIGIATQSATFTFNGPLNVSSTLSFANSASSTLAFSGTATLGGIIITNNPNLSAISGLSGTAQSAAFTNNPNLSTQFINSLLSGPFRVSGTKLISGNGSP